LPDKRLQNVNLVCDAMGCVDVFNDNDIDNEIRDGDADGDRQLYADISVTQLNGADAKVKDVAKLLVIKRSAEGLTFQFATRRGQDDLRWDLDGRTAQNRTRQDGGHDGGKQHSRHANMQINTLTIFSQIKYAIALRIPLFLYL